MRLLAAFSLFLMATPGVAQTSPQFEGAGAERQLSRNPAKATPVDSLDALITGIMAEHELPGVALLVMKGNRVIKEGYYGIDLEAELFAVAKAVTPATLKRLHGLGPAGVRAGIGLAEAWAPRLVHSGGGDLERGLAGDRRLVLQVGHATAEQWRSNIT